jgi:hypothetical protein
MEEWTDDGGRETGDRRRETGCVVLKYVYTIMPNRQIYF